MKLTITLPLLACLFLGCSQSPPVDDTIVPEQEAPTVAQAVHRVATVDDFLAAIGPDRVIELDASVMYQLDQATRGVSDYYQWKQVFGDEYELLIRNCPGLTIRSASDELTHMVTRFGYTFVLSFENCDDLTLQRLKLGHPPDPGGCSGGVIEMSDSNRIVIEQSELYGCGTVGVALKLVRDFTLAHSIVEKCTYGIMTAEESRNLLFRDSEFRDNQRYYGFVFRDSIGIRFDNCDVIDNVADSEFSTVSLFDTNLNSMDASIQFRGGRIAGNRAGQLSTSPALLKTSGTNVNNNQLRIQP